MDHEILELDNRRIPRLDSALISNHSRRSFVAFNTFKGTIRLLSAPEKSSSRQTEKSEANRLIVLRASAGGVNTGIKNAVKLLHYAF